MSGDVKATFGGGGEQPDIRRPGLPGWELADEASSLSTPKGHTAETILRVELGTILRKRLSTTRSDNIQNESIIEECNVE